eukprot:gb/GEZN01004439.1/.p1 GENE.gb/GEZN01004439.1/~~gb/GEZN01004439.1/.p1  ORF type:complete len:502 (+),score=75.47 gb/GEZN01004439.1/:265-1770(+)
MMNLTRVRPQMPKLAGSSRGFASKMIPGSASPAYNPSILQTIFAKSEMPRIPLDSFALAEKNPSTPAPAVDLSLKTSKLSNGLTVMSTDSHSPLSNVALLVKSGSRNETAHSSGISHFMEYMAFQGTKHRSPYATVRDNALRAISAKANASRESLLFTGEAMRNYLPELLSTFADSLSYPLFALDEIEDVKLKYLDDSQKHSHDNEQLMSEAVHAAAFHNNSLGRPFYSDDNLGTFTPENLADWHKTFYTAPRMVLGVVGVKHDELMEFVTPTFANLNEDSGFGSGESVKYTGGDVRLFRKATSKEFVQFTLAFEAPSWASDDVFAMCVLQMLMGGGGSFSAGGPGKGMYSRLMENVLNRYAWVEQADTIANIYDDSGLFGLRATARAENAADLVSVLVGEARGMTSKITDEELKRAKNLLKSSIFIQLEQSRLHVEDMVRQYATYGKVIPAMELCARIDKVTAADIQRVAKKMLTSKPATAAVGDLSNLPSYSEICQKLS